MKVFKVPMSIPMKRKSGCHNVNTPPFDSAAICQATHQSNVTDTRPQVSSSLSLANTFWLAIVRLLSGEPVGYTEPKNRDRNCERKAAQKQWQGQVLSLQLV